MAKAIKWFVMLAAGVVAVVSVSALFAWMIFAEPKHKSASDADITALAQMAHVVVGDVALVLPFVAMPDQISAGSFFSLDRRGVQDQWRIERDAFRLAAAQPEGAPVLVQIKVRVETYGWNDFDWTPWLKICGQLTQKWARSVCDDPWAPLQQALPRDNFYLADDRHFDAFQGHLIAGRETVADQLRAMNLQTARASVVCDREITKRGRFCRAAVPIFRHLVAVWSVWDSPEETAEARADREARAIVAFVTHGLGAVEDFDALLAVVCKERRPGSGPSGITSAPADPCAG